MRTCGKIGRMNKKGIDAMLKNYHVVLGVIVALCMACLLACGDSSGDSKSAAPEVVDPVAETYATEDDLPGCIEKRLLCPLRKGLTFHKKVYIEG